MKSNGIKKGKIQKIKLTRFAQGYFHQNDIIKERRGMS